MTRFIQDTAKAITAKAITAKAITRATRAKGWRKVVGTKQWPGLPGAAALV